MITFKGRIGNVEYMLPRNKLSGFYAYAYVKQHRIKIAAFMNSVSPFMKYIMLRFDKKKK